MTAKATPAQTAALQRVRRAAIRLKDARATAEERIRLAIQEESTQLRMAVKEAVQQAWATLDDDGNRPAKRLLKDAIMSKDHSTLEFYLNGFEDGHIQQFVIDTVLSTFTINWFQFADGDRVEGSVTKSINESGSIVWDFSLGQDSYSIKLKQLAEVNDFIEIGKFSSELNDALLEAGVVVE